MTTGTTADGAATLAACSVAASSKSGNSDSCCTSDRPEKPTPTRRIGPISIGSSSRRRAMAISVAASVVA